MNESANVYLVAITAMTLASTIIKMVYDWIVQKRDRAWKLEDDKRQADLLAKHIELKRRIEENTQLTQTVKDETIQAVRDANGASQKLADSQKLTVDAVKSVVEALKPRDPNVRTRSSDGG